ncbi:PREDICTED: phosphatidylinositol:ceramide inositolphosphotransferase 2-like [Nicotiana attenuata]|uniref:phosphatidylinositol:ceramide inositolphosphotransferase 2-like n=1 Tax=Nicotiana attenuata TaxID=49451 RepID=UPI000904BB38|nr:PREDICTED: phosphatidylinositol:ceramide inositolphosphotransferase 2-like [Nicotiana attenuata]
MEESMCRDCNRNQSSCGELEVYFWRFDISGVRAVEIASCKKIQVHIYMDLLLEGFTTYIGLDLLSTEFFLPVLPDRTSAALFLPLSKDSKTKEENHKFLHGNSGDPAEWI